MEPRFNAPPTLAESGIDKKQEVGNQSVFRVSRQKGRLWVALRRTQMVWEGSR